MIRGYWRVKEEHAALHSTSPYVPLLGNCCTLFPVVVVAPYSMSFSKVRTFAVAAKFSYGTIYRHTAIGQIQQAACITSQQQQLEPERCDVKQEL